MNTISKRFSDIRSFRAAWLFVLGLSLVLSACVPTSLQLPQSPLLKALERKSGLILYVGTDGNIHATDQGGTQVTSVTDDANLEAGDSGKLRFYLHPTISRDGKRLAYIGLEGTAAGLEVAKIFTSNIRGEDKKEIFSSSDLQPFYLYWSPDGQEISFLATAKGTGASALILAPGEGGNYTMVDAGTSVYWAWAPDNKSILTHSSLPEAEGKTDRLSIHLLVSPQEGLDLDLLPVSFQAPEWSPDGQKILLAVKPPEKDSESLVIVNSRGAIEREVARIASPTAFGWSPDGSHIAYITSVKESGTDAVNTLKVADLARPGKDSVISDSLVVAFFWSPDGKKLAYFSPINLTPDSNAPDKQVQGFGLSVYDVKTGDSHKVTAFIPGEQFTTIVAYFDQYQHSASIWSPDSRNLVLSEVDKDGNPGIVIVDASGNLAPRFIAEGHQAFWSWK